VRIREEPSLIWLCLAFRINTLIHL
jgi:hypothetical protein